MVDADYNFVFANVGSQGRISDGGVFKNTLLWKLIEEKRINFPNSEPLPGRQKPVPYVILSDEAFALHEHIMKPFSGVHPKGSMQRVFNYRLSRARRVVENAFGILSAVFRVLRKPMLLEPKKASLVVLSTIYLHNFLRQSECSRNIYNPPGTFDFEKDGRIFEGSWRNEQNEHQSFLSLKKVPRKSSFSAQEIRNEIGQYFVTNGTVSWQNDYA